MIAVLHLIDWVTHEIWCCADNYNWCTVHDTSYDVLLFPAIGVTLACLFQGRFSTTAVLIIGAQPLAGV